MNEYWKELFGEENKEELCDMVDEFVEYCKQRDWPIDRGSFEMYFDEP